MSDENEVIIEDTPEDIEYQLEAGEKKKCTITKTVKNGLYYTAYAKCPDGSTKTGTSSNINVAKGLACQACE